MHASMPVCTVEYKRLGMTHVEEFYTTEAAEEKILMLRATTEAKDFTIQIHHPVDNPAFLYEAARS